MTRATMLPANADVIFNPPIATFIEQRQDAHYTVVCGGNNSGKSLVLKNLRATLGPTAYMAGPSRFYHIVELSTQRYNDEDYANWDNQFRQNANNRDFNFEQNFIDLGRIIGALKDAKRLKLFELCGEMIGNKFTLKRRDPDNEMSPRYIDMDGQNMALGSTGTRLLMTLLGLCMDEKFSTLIIDEPELGLSPRIQIALASFFGNRARRDELFPHLKHVVVATHSHMFLDKIDVTNNFVITKESREIRINQVSSMSGLHDLQFNLLGNSLESLFLPSAIVIVEGKTDKPFVDRAVSLRYPGKKILVIEGQGDVQRIFQNLCTSLGDFQKSPFRDRTFIVLDSVHTKGTSAKLVSLGAKSSNVIVWRNNGIEFIYPPAVMSSIYSSSEAGLSRLSILDDDVSLNGITKRKHQLSDEVVAALRPDTVHAQEFEKSLLLPIGKAIGEA